MAAVQFCQLAQGNFQGNIHQSQGCLQNLCHMRLERASDACRFEQWTTFLVGLEPLQALLVVLPHVVQLLHRHLLLLQRLQLDLLALQLAEELVDGAVKGRKLEQRFVLVLSEQVGVELDERGKLLFAALGFRPHFQLLKLGT